MPSYEDVVAELRMRHPHVEETKMMGMPSLKAHGKLVAGFVPDEQGMFFKLTYGAAHERALALKGAHLFEPMQGRQMKQWVVVPKAQSAKWLELAEAALR